MSAINDTTNYQLSFPVNGRENILADMYRVNVKKIDRAMYMEVEDRKEAVTAERNARTNADKALSDRIDNAVAEIDALTKRVETLEELVLPDETPSE